MKMRRFTKWLVTSMLAAVMALGLAIPAMAAENTWATKASIPTVLIQASSAAIGSNIYIMGGNDGTTGNSKFNAVYNTNTNTWTTKANIPIGINYASASAFNGNIYLFGGNMSSNVQMYDPSTNVWIQKSNAPRNFHNSEAVTLNNKIYLIGGYSATSIVSNSVHEYDPATDTWTQKANLPAKRTDMASAVLNGKIYIIGGTDPTSTGFSSAVYEYNPQNDTWTTKAPLAQKLVGAKGAAAWGKIYVFGGAYMDANGSIFDSNQLLEYNPGTDAWTPRNSMPIAKIQFTGVAASGKIYAFGGKSPSTTRTSDVYEYTPIGYVASPDSPFDLSATSGNAQVDLSWDGSSGTISYVVKRSTTAGGPYTTVATGVTGNTYTDSDVANGTTYYYIVIAVNEAGESDPSNEASATPEAPVEPEEPDNTRALLTLYLAGGQIKEYDLSAAQLDAFLTWYDAKADGIGPARYGFEKTWNKGPFKTRTEYVIFSKIDTFDVDEYEVVDEE